LLCMCEFIEEPAAGGNQAERFASVEGLGVEALLDLEGLVDVERERGRLVNKAQKAHAESVKARAKLGNKGFVAKAPEAVVAEEQSRLSAAEAVLAEVKRQYRERVGGDLPLPEGKQP
jgi:valyl-tRNA synthetase